MTERDRGSLLPQARDAMDRLYEKKADPYWNAYMERERRVSDLEELATNPEFFPIFQRRALQTLLTPSIPQLPFSVHKKEEAYTNAPYISKDLGKKLSPELSEYVAELIPQYINQAREMLEDGRKKRKSDPFTESALETYNFIIPSLLSRIPHDKAEELFNHFEINDPIVYAGREDASGYNPLKHMLRDTEVDEVWKKKAVARIHTHIEEEKSGKATPREDHEDASKRYKDILGSICYGEELPVSREFFQDEIVYLLRVDTTPVVQSWETRKVLSLLQGNNVRQHFARRQVLSATERYRFYVNNEDQATLAGEILEEFPDDLEMKNYLEGELAKYTIKTTQELQERQQKEIREQAILNAMKKPKDQLTSHF